jgi:multicomponent Na+:H+ antiporter subunit F
MTSFLLANVVVLLLVLLAGLSRVIKGPTACDRMLASQLFGTAGVAILILLAAAQQQLALLNTALVLALLAPLTLIAFLKLHGGSE